ncbi:MAG: hypothetical protein AB7O45_16070 [Alphaproteobacteria bacterium]
MTATGPVFAAARLGVATLQVVERTDGAEIRIEGHGLSLALAIEEDALRATGRRLIEIADKQVERRITIDAAWRSGARR